MTRTLAIIVGIVLLIALLLFSMTYTVNFHEVAIKTRFGRVTENSIVREAGLQFRLPLFADKVTTFDTRLQIRESPLETVQTADGQQVIVRAFLMWKVDVDSEQGPLRFFESYSSVEEANTAMGDQFKTAMRSGLSRFTFNELIGEGSRLAEAEAAIKSEMAAVESKGIKPVSVGVTQLVLPARTATAVLNRMNTTRTRLSEEERGKGQAEASALQNRAAAQADKIQAFAERAAAEIRAQGDQDAARYYAMMSEAQDLAVFMQWLDAWKTSLSRYTTVVLPSTFAPFNLFNLESPTNERGIPIPATGQPSFTGNRPPAAGMSMTPMNPAAEASAPTSTPTSTAAPARDTNAEKEQVDG